jgi:hypothetical protein
MPDCSRINPLAFDVLRSEYYTMGGRAGKAFAAGKKFLKKK